MLLISTTITRKLDFQELGDGREEGFRETWDEVGRGLRLFSEPVRPIGKLMRASFFNQILFGCFTVFLRKENDIFRPPVMRNILACS